MTYLVEPRHLSDDNEETFAVEIEAPTNALLQMPSPVVSLLSAKFPVRCPPTPLATHVPTNLALCLVLRPPTSATLTFLLADSRFDPLGPIIINSTLHPEAEYLFGSHELKRSELPHGNQVRSPRLS